MLTILRTLAENQKKLEDRMQLNENNHKTLQSNLGILQNDMRGAAYFNKGNIQQIKHYVGQFSYDLNQQQQVINQQYGTNVWNYVNRY